MNKMRQRNIITDRKEEEMEVQGEEEEGVKTGQPRQPLPKEVEGIRLPGMISLLLELLLLFPRRGIVTVMKGLGY